jgi:hypothetical protein
MARTDVGIDGQRHCRRCHHGGPAEEVDTGGQGPEAVAG